MFVQNFIELSVAVRELSWVLRKKIQTNTIQAIRYRADSNYCYQDKMSNVGCRYDTRPSFLLPSVSVVDSELGHRASM